MSEPAKRRTHLVERAFQAMGGAPGIPARPPEAEITPEADKPDIVADAPPPGPIARATALPATTLPSGQIAAPGSPGEGDRAPAAAVEPAPPTTGLSSMGTPGNKPAADAGTARGSEVGAGTATLPRPDPAADMAAKARSASAGVTTTLPRPEAAPRPVVTPPTFERMRAAGLVNAPNGPTRTRLAEEFSVVHHQILRTIRTMEPPAEGSGRGRRVVLVTSARPGEGKTFCSLNLAVSIAHGRSAPVLLVDADGKRGSLSEALGLADAPGLRLLAADPAQPPAPLMVPTEQRNLSILPYGAPVPGLPTVPPGTTVAAAVQRLSAMLPQHVIILDSPPCLSTSDPSSLAPVAGQVLLVVEAEKTQRAEVEASLDLVEACPVLQLMLNQTQMNSSDTFGAYGGYGGYGVYGGYGPKPESSG